jgi:putative transposase
MEAVDVLAPEVGLSRACAAMRIPRGSVYREDARQRHLLAPAATPATRPAPPLALDSAERGALLEALNSVRFANCAPATVYATLLDEGLYLGSVRTMYRMLADAGQSSERRAQRVHPAYAKPELLATDPNQVWSWDITKLKGPSKWTCFHLYVILDIFSRYVVGWMIARQENAALAKELIKESYGKHEVRPGHLVLHADRGTQMTSKTLAQLLADLDVASSFNRPHVSNDNPFSESQFKTAKYHPSYPGKFSAIEDALTWGRELFPWYNDEHKHSGIAFLTPADVHYGRADDVLGRRHLARLKGYEAHPERFPHGPPRRVLVPDAVYINPPKGPDSSLCSSSGAEQVVRVDALDDALGERKPPSDGHRSRTPTTEELVR